MTLNWMKCDYVTEKVPDGEKLIEIIELIVDDIHANKSSTITHIIIHTKCQAFIQNLINQLHSDFTRLAGNIAYILGTVAEHELGNAIVLDQIEQFKSPKIDPILKLVEMLKLEEDSETVMNAAGTLGTLAENQKGRQIILNRPDLFRTLISSTNQLLTSKNIWTASNAALVLARISIADEGCQMILNLEYVADLLLNLINCLGIDEAGCGMNAAFTIGRICDSGIGMNFLMKMPDRHKMIDMLAEMLDDSESGFSKNACFCLSSIAVGEQGHCMIMNSSCTEKIIEKLSHLLLLPDEETAWFAGMSIRTLASHQKGCLFLRKHSEILKSLKACAENSKTCEDLRQECRITLKLLAPLEKPNMPEVSVISSNQIMVKWNEIKLPSSIVLKSDASSNENSMSIIKNSDQTEMPFVYLTKQVAWTLFMFQKNSNDETIENENETTEHKTIVYHGKKTEKLLENLQAYQEYSFQLQFESEFGEKSPFSSKTTPVKTREDYPTKPEKLRVIAITATQVKISWEFPIKINGVFKSFCIFLNNNFKETTTDQVSIISGLQPSTTYSISVCAINNKGRGNFSAIGVTTLGPGPHAPNRPNVIVLGRSEVQVSWDPPESPLGRIFRYDVLLNSTKVVYSGVANDCRVANLRSDTEYAFSVQIVTSEGKYESRQTKRRTNKDEYAENARPSLYDQPTFSSSQQQMQQSHQKQENVKTLVRSNTSSFIPSSKNSVLIYKNSIINTSSNESSANLNSSASISNRRSSLKKQSSSLQFFNKSSTQMISQNASKSFNAKDSASTTNRRFNRRRSSESVYTSFENPMKNEVDHSDKSKVIFPPLKHPANSTVAASSTSFSMPPPNINNNESHEFLPQRSLTFINLSFHDDHLTANASSSINTALEHANNRKFSGNSNQLFITNQLTRKKSSINSRANPLLSSHISNILKNPNQEPSAVLNHPSSNLIPVNHSSQSVAQSINQPKSAVKFRL